MDKCAQNNHGVTLKHGSIHRSNRAFKRLSVEKEDECKIYNEWIFGHTEDSGEAGSDCPCGKTGIRYICYIRNKITRKQTLETRGVRGTGEGKKIGREVEFPS